MNTQKFKGDAEELKYDACAQPLLDAIGLQLDDFLSGAYAAGPLGDILVTQNRAPLSQAMAQDIFRSSFSLIFQEFQVAGTFESYLVVFRKIFGDSVDVEFTVSAPGKLAIDITTTGLDLSNFVARTLVDGVYEFDNVIYSDDDGQDNIVFQTLKGFKSQYELEQMLFELVPEGVFTAITLNFA